MNMLHFGILGTGNIAHQFAEGVVGSKRCRIAAVGSRAQSTAEEFGLRFSVANRHGSYECLITDPTVDAVYVSLPNSMHYTWTLKALEAGKHVLCEKPLSTNFAEAEQMFNAASKHGRTLVEAFMYRSHPLTRTVLQLVREGTIGQLKLIRSSFCYSTRKIDGNIRFNRSLAGGALMDVGCYCISLSRLFAGAEPLASHCFARLHESGVDEYAAATLQFPEGIVGSFVCGMSVQTNNAAHICGETGYIEMPVPWKPPVDKARFILAAMASPQQELSDAVPSGRRIPKTAPAPKVVQVEAGIPLFGLEADDFAAAVLDGDTPAVTKSETLGNMRALDTLRKQAGVVMP